MKKYIVLLAVLLTLTSIMSCVSFSGRFIRGTVVYLEMEGGFYGIITDDGESLLPLNLSEEHQVNGMLIYFTYSVEEDIATIQQWGTPVTINSVSFSR